MYVCVFVKTTCERVIVALVFFFFFTHLSLFVEIVASEYDNTRSLTHALTPSHTIQQGEKYDQGLCFFTFLVQEGDCSCGLFMETYPECMCAPRC